ncbi:MAG: zinc protease [Blastocatellia bacterium]|jgi:zinc protease|nr:zinc protease [Blastocatellia bacterium]
MATMLLRISRLLSVALLVGGASIPTVTAQTMNQTEDFRRQAPAPLASKPLNIPKPYETTLANGLQVVIVEDTRLPLVSYRLAFRAGSANDPNELPGLTGVMADLLNEGTETRTSKQIADEVARLGATLSAGVNSDYTTVAASALSMYGDQILDLLADITLHPSYPQNELDLSRQNRKQGLLAQRSQPAFLASERLSRILFGQHPYATVSSTPESLDAITRDKLLSFQRAMFIPNNAVLVVVGNVKRDAVMQRVNELFGKWAKGQTQTDNFPAPPARNARAIYVVDRPGSAQSNIVIANTSINRTSPDYFPMLVMHTVLGANASSRLFMNLREKRGLTYGAYSILDTRRAAGTFRSSAEVRTAVTGESVKEFLSELERIRTEPVSEKELMDAKSYLTGVFPIRIETQEGLVDQFVQIKMYGLPADYLQTYRERVNAITAADIERVAKQNITPDRVAIVIVGDAAAISDQIKPFAQTVELYDTNGKRKEMTATNGTGTPKTTNGGGSSSGFLGSWKLEITSPNGQALPATLTMKQDGQTLNGSVMTQLGEATLSDINLNGNSFDATLKLNAHGQTMEGKVSGSVDTDKMKGEINLQNLPPLPFIGTRESK